MWLLQYTIDNSHITLIFNHITQNNVQAETSNTSRTIKINPNSCKALH